MEKLKRRIEVTQKMNPHLQNRLVKLIGEKPILKCRLGAVESRVLWDTGSMVSVVDRDWVKENAPNAVLHPISDFTGTDNVEFKAANNSDVSMMGSVIIEFSLGKNSFPVPFLVSTDKLSLPILGYNVIEHLVGYGEENEVVT